MHRTIYSVTALGLVLIFAGCGEKPIQTVKLGGTVTVDGKNMPHGTVTFYRADQDGASPVSAPIVDGQFSAPVVPTGQYRAAFFVGPAPDSVPSEAMSSSDRAPDPKAKRIRDPITEKYRTPSLPVDATADNTNLKFELKSN